jgi:NAD+-dependent farnesol dehydrogenase
VRILVTGGTGYLGQAVVRALASRGHEVVVFARRATASGLPGTFVDGDVREPAAVERACRGVDAICHMAALVSIWRRRREEFDEVNVGGLRHVLDAAAALGIRRIAYTSSFLALPPAGRAAPLEANDYQRTKVAADRLAEERVQAGAPLVRLYPGVVYGPGRVTEGNLVGRLIEDHLRGRLPGLIGPERRWSCAYIDDVAAAHGAAIERGAPGRRYMLGGVNTTPREMFTIVESLTGRRPPRRIPYAVASAIGAFEEARARLSGSNPLVTRGAVEIFRWDWPLDSALAASELDYRVTPLGDGVARTVGALRT